MCSGILLFPFWYETKLLGQPYKETKMKFLGQRKGVIQFFQEGKH